VCRVNENIGLKLGQRWPTPGRGWVKHVGRTLKENHTSERERKKEDDLANVRLSVDSTPSALERDYFRVDELGRKKRRKGKNSNELECPVGYMQGGFRHMGKKLSYKWPKEWKRDQGRGKKHSRGMGGWMYYWKGGGNIPEPHASSGKNA